jgi:hypothetical protein
MERLGVPHEETVIVPVLAAIVLFKLYENAVVSGGIGAFSFIFVCAMAGAWLSISMKVVNILTFYVRAIYVGVLSSFGMIAVSSTAPNYVDGQHFSAAIISLSFVVFAISAMTAMAVKEIVLSPPLTDDQKAKLRNRRDKAHHFFRMVIGADDKKGEGTVAVASVVAAQYVLGTLIIGALTKALFDFLGEPIRSYFLK